MPNTLEGALKAAEQAVNEILSSFNMPLKATETKSAGESMVKSNWLQTHAPSVKSLYSYAGWTLFSLIAIKALKR
jgi:hypothetical protein